MDHRGRPCVSTQTVVTLTKIVTPNAMRQCLCFIYTGQIDTRFCSLQVSFFSLSSTWKWFYQKPKESLIFQTKNLFCCCSVASDVDAVGKSFFSQSINVWITHFSISFWLLANYWFVELNHRKFGRQQSFSIYRNCWPLFTTSTITKSSSITMYASSIDRLSLSLLRCVSSIFRRPWLNIQWCSSKNIKLSDARKGKQMANPNNIWFDFVFILARLYRWSVRGYSNWASIKACMPTCTFCWTTVVAQLTGLYWWPDVTWWMPCSQAISVKVQPKWSDTLALAIDLIKLF